MSRKDIGIKQARPILGDLVTAVQQGADVVLTRNGKPVARIVRYKEQGMDHISYTETYNGDIADLAMSPAMDDLLRETLAEHNDQTEIEAEIKDAITAKLREHGVDGEGEWLGQWSPEQIVRGILTAHGITCPA